MRVNEQETYRSPQEEVASRLSKGEVLISDDLGPIYEAHGYAPLTGRSTLHGSIVSGYFFQETGVSVTEMRYKNRIIYMCDGLEEASPSLAEVKSKIDDDFQRYIDRRKSLAAQRRARRSIP